MKLASLNNNTIDGELIVVSRDLKYYVSAKSISSTMQYALDNWAIVVDELEDLYSQLNDNKLKTKFFNEKMSYLPCQGHINGQMVLRISITFLY